MAAVHDVSIRQLQYVVAVADTLGFHRAAQRCHVSQPSLSAQVKQLEDTLGVAVFERDRRRVLVTPAGEAIVARARRALREVEDLVATAAHLRDPLAGPVRLGVIPTIAPYALPDVVPSVHAAYPSLKLIFREEKTESVVAGLRAGTLDLGIVALEADLGELEHATFAVDPFVAALPAEHPLAKKKIVTEDDLDGETVLLLDDGHCLRSQALAVCTRAGAHESELRATSLSTLAQMVSGGAGVTLLPAIAVPVENRRGTLAIRKLRPVPSRTLAVVWRPGSPFAAAGQALAGVLKKALRATEAIS